MLNETDDRYECLNIKCRESFFRATVDKYNQLGVAEQNAINELDAKKTRSWFGNQYYDSKRKKWRDGEQPIRVSWVHNKWHWLLIPLLFILISVIITLILNYFHPGSKFAILGW